MSKGTIIMGEFNSNFNFFTVACTQEFFFDIGVIVQPEKNPSQSEIRSWDPDLETRIYTPSRIWPKTLLYA